MEPAFEHLPREKQLRILNAAMKVFARNDYRYASTDDIAAQAGISKGLLFYYFHNKKQLYLFCYDQAVRLVDRQLKAMQAAGQTDFFELLLLGGQAKVALMEQCPGCWNSPCAPLKAGTRRSPAGFRTRWRWI